MAQEEHHETAMLSIPHDNLLESLTTSTPESLDQDRSSAEISLEENGGERTVSDDGDEVHPVTFTTTIAMAIPTDGDPDHGVRKPKTPSSKRRAREEAQNFYHLEYSLLPGQDLMKVDVVTYGMVAKVFMEKHEARVIKAIQGKEITWIAWVHTLTVPVTRGTLQEMADHTLEMRVWDSKIKCSVRAQNDRPTGFRLPPQKPRQNPRDVVGVKNTVRKQMDHFRRIPRHKTIPLRPLPDKCVFPREKADGSKPNVESRQSSSVESDKMSGKGSAKDKMDPTQKGQKDLKVKELKQTALIIGEMVLPEDDFPQRLLQKKAAAEAAAAAKRVKDNGICYVAFPLACLFSDSHDFTSRLQQPVPGVEDLFLTVSLDKPLLSEKQRQELNPVTITVRSLTDMPHCPLSFEQMRNKYRPVYCKYKFFNQPTHITVAKEHDRTICLEDKHVFLIGAKEQAEMLEYVSGPAMEAEVHDRHDRSADQPQTPALFGQEQGDQNISHDRSADQPQTPALFGQEQGDQNISHDRSADQPQTPALFGQEQGDQNISAAASGCIQRSRAKVTESYGIARVDLSELAWPGQRFLKLKVPISICRLLDDADQDLHQRSRSHRHTGAVLTLEVELFRPLIEYSGERIREHCPFGRIVFVFPYHKMATLRQLTECIQSINARGLDLDDCSPAVVDAAFFTYKLSIEQQSSKSLDIVTGFHVADREKHIVVLEGLRDQGIRQLYTALPMEGLSQDLLVLYNSDMSFSHRLYSEMDVDLKHTWLNEPLTFMVHQPRLYVRHLVPRACFHAITKLYQISQAHRLRDLVKGDLFPTAAMVTSLSREFGIPFTLRDFEDQQRQSELLTASSTLEQTQLETTLSNRTSPAGHASHSFADECRERLTQQHTNAETQQKWLQHDRSSQVTVAHADVNMMKDHGVQTLTPSQMEKMLAAQQKQHQRQQQKLLQQQKQQELCSRNTEYLYRASLTADNRMSKLVAKAEAEASKQLWLTPSGWMYSCARTGTDDNSHPKKPDSARLDELKEKWPGEKRVKTFTDRGPLPWARRKEDMDLLNRPGPILQPLGPLSIFPPKLKQEEEAKKAAARQGPAVVQSPPHFHRLLPQTEKTWKGYKSCNQIDRLTDIRKDPPQKLSLRHWAQRDIPPLSVVHYPSVDTKALCPAAPTQGHIADPQRPLPVIGRTTAKEAHSDIHTANVGTMTTDLLQTDTRKRSLMFV